MNKMCQKVSNKNGGIDVATSESILDGELTKDSLPDKNHLGKCSCTYVCT
jgi:hypothetical protein